MDSPDSIISTLPVRPLRPTQRIGLLMGRWWIAFSLSSICVVFGHLMIKAGLNAASTMRPVAGVLPHVLHLLEQPATLAGLIIYLFGTGCWMIAVSQKEISFLYPLSSVNYVLVFVASGLFLSESISLRRAEGILLIVLGMFLLNRGSRRVRE